MSTDGIVGAYTGNDFTVRATFTVFLGIALYNSAELIVLVLTTFRRYHGLYFWSLLLAGTLGVIPQSISFLLKYYSLAPVWFSLTLSTLGWYFMVTGQALVLFSRLNLVVQNPDIRRGVLAMIIVDAIALHIPTTILTYGSNFIATPVWVRAYTIMERIELTGFCLQEFIISGLYIHETIKILRLQPPNEETPSQHPGHSNRKIMYQLLGINLLIIVLDIVLIIVEYLNFFVIQTTLKSLVYSIKLKLEFGVLGRLVFLVRSHQYRPDRQNHNDQYNRPFASLPSPDDRHIQQLHQLHQGFPDFVDVSRITVDYTHAPRPAGHISLPWEEDKPII
ncbi:hypothetical protein ASPZODRAFT_136735 [Penicilliopsis zonata CBS 506.65]|uniref:DUF7703 domain-containing protein n=1 Tax=Penicilliopsis zonata CBS 506.65 TaxID=1073090 RepID=A0A1L9S7P5_9EURO|nr:hypothetical protein ASPZODRAFT_136735 [Penicilliopsis zonata CBS 506.65]OJJ43176.1 hypothetical protein ASPZODRAFT_136735 [Penicilliopsis zonata CBS 506.65]